MLLQQKDDSYQWIWIDLESGVPAIFAMNIFSTLTYYLPKCLKHKEWMFDTVDVAKLESYLRDNKHELEKDLGQEVYGNMIADTEELNETQNRWKNIKRYKRSIHYAKSQGKITEEESEHYLSRPLAWYMNSIISFMFAFFRKIGKGFRKVKNIILNFKYARFFHHGFKYTTSARYRWGVARWYLQKEVKKWYARKSIDVEDRKFLLSELHKDDVSSYLTDFSVHLALKPLDQIITFLVIPIIVASCGWDVSTGIFLAMAVGPATRTIYTLWRFTHSLAKRQNYPVIALIVGALPVVGNLAYPAELFFRGTGNRDMLAKFILFAFSAKIGAKLPIWGGKDSGTEHFFNRWSYKLLS